MTFQNSHLKLLAAAFCLSLTTPTLAQKKKKTANPPSTTAESAAPVESVLDRLEKQMIEQDQEGLTFGKGASPKEKTSASYRFDKKQVLGSTAESSQLADVALAVTELENQVDALTQDVQRARLKVVEDAKFNNSLDVTLSVERPDSVAIRQLEISLDGFPLYAVDEASGLWLPSRTFPIYSGPIDAGNHKLKLIGKLVGKNSEAPASPNDQLISVDSEFPLNISTKNAQQKYEVIVRSNPKSPKVASAELVEKRN